MRYKQVPFAKNKWFVIDELLTYSEAPTLLAHFGSPVLQVAHILECASTDPGRPPKTPYKQHPIIKSHPLIVFQNLTKSDPDFVLFHLGPCPPRGSDLPFYLAADTRLQFCQQRLSIPILPLCICGDPRRRAVGRSGVAIATRSTCSSSRHWRLLSSQPHQTSSFSPCNN